MQKLFLALLALPLLALSGAPARAADEPAPRRWLDTKDYRPGPMVYGWRYRAGPAVYGWRYRPGVYRWGSCGVYRYWDGTQCVDARHTPPEF